MKYMKIFFSGFFSQLKIRLSTLVLMMVFLFLLNLVFSTGSTLDKEMKSVVQLNVTTEVPTDSQFTNMMDDWAAKNNRLPLRPFFSVQHSLGTGFFVNKEGIIVTNYHVAGKANSIGVKFPDGKEGTAEIVGTDQQTDIAVLRLHKPKDYDFTSVTFGNSSTVKAGQTVFALGSPFGLSFSLSKGIVSFPDRQNILSEAGELTDVFQVDAAINPGNSGGPLFDDFGHVIGINDAIISKEGEFVGIGLSLRINDVLPVIDKIEKYGKVTRGMLGAQIEDISDGFATILGVPNKGVYVQSVNDNASVKGLVFDQDIILSVDGKEVDTVSDLRRLIFSHEAGDVLDLEILRNGDHIHHRVVLKPQ